MVRRLSFSAVAKSVPETLVTVATGLSSFPVLHRWHPPPLNIISNFLELIFSLLPAEISAADRFHWRNKTPVSPNTAAGININSTSSWHWLLRLLDIYCTSNICLFKILTEHPTSSGVKDCIVYACMCLRCRPRAGLQWGISERLSLQADVIETNMTDKIHTSTCDQWSGAWVMHSCRLSWF